MARILFCDVSGKAFSPLVRLPAESLPALLPYFLSLLLLSPVVHSIKLKVLLLDGQADRSNLRVLSLNQPGRCNSVHPAHINIHHDDFRLKVFHTSKGLFTIARFTNYFDGRSEWLIKMCLQNGNRS